MGFPGVAELADANDSKSFGLTPISVRPRAPGPNPLRKVSMDSIAALKWAYQLNLAHLYKYGSNVDWLEGVIVRSEIYCPTIAELNDPRDSRPRIRTTSAARAVELLQGCIRSYAQGRKMPDDERDRALNEVEEAALRLSEDELLRWATDKLHALSETVRVYCLSKRWNNLSMWAKYANEHRGYCLEFFVQGSTLLMSAAEINYSETIGLELTDPSDVPNWYYFKSPEWSNEEEMRIRMPLFWDPVVQLSPGVISGIIVGERMSDRDVSRIEAWSKTRWCPMTLRRAKFDRYEGKLVLEDIQGSAEVLS